MRVVTPCCLIILLVASTAAPVMGQREFDRGFHQFDDRSNFRGPFAESGWRTSDSVRLVTPFDVLARHGWDPAAWKFRCGTTDVAPLTDVEDSLTRYASFDEFVELAADSLQPFPKVEHAWGKVRRRASFRLSDSSTLVLDRRSRPGVYDLDKALLLVVAKGGRGGVRWQTRPKLTRALEFRMVCRRSAGVVVAASEDTTLWSEAQLLEEFFRHHEKWIGAVSYRDSLAGPFALRIWDPLSRTELPMPNPHSRLARVIWLTFDADRETPPRLFICCMAHRRMPSDSLPGSRQVSAIPPSRRALANARVLGSVLVDLKSGRVIQRVGDVR